VSPEGHRRSHSTSRTYGGTGCASFAICSRDGVFGLASGVAKGWNIAVSRGVVSVTGVSLLIMS